MGLELDFSRIFAGFVFGTFGIYLLQRGRKLGNIPWILLGLTAIVFPYFLNSTVWIWILGCAILGAAYSLR